MLATTRRLLVLAGTLGLGCFSDAGGEQACEPGEQVACDCVDGEGVQVCMMSGLGFEPCQCGDDTGGSGSASGSMSSTSATTTASSSADASASSATTASDTTDGETTADSGATTGEPAPEVVINEVVHDPVGGGTDEWIEIHNNSAEQLDLSYWKIHDGFNILDFPSGTVIEANGYLTFTRNEIPTFGWELPDEGMLVLQDIEYVTIDMTSWSVGEAAEPYSWGRSPDGTGAFAELTPTKGTANE